MPKATKKKAERNADFKKAKLKLGKGKKAAENSTDTSFKARSIALPSQKQLDRALNKAPDAEEAAQSSSGVPTTASGLTLDDVLIQLRHVNAGVRKEAFNHLKEVLISGVNKGIKLGERHGEVAKVVRACGGLVSDEDQQVRKCLHEFLGWYLSRLPKQALSPYLSLLQLQISSALSHIFPAIRIDACKLVELLLETHPADVVGSWPVSDVSGSGAATPVSAVPTSGSTIFDGLRLSAGLGEEKGASTQAGFRFTTSTKLVILRTIKTFIGKALESTAQTGLQPKRAATPKLGEWTLTELQLLPADQWSLQTDSDWAVACEFDGGERVHSRDLTVANGALEEVMKTYLALHSLLLSTFMEAAPSAFPPSSSSTSTAIDETSLNLCSVCTELVWIFARTFHQSPEFDSLPSAAELTGSFSAYVKRMTAWFPFSKGQQAAGATENNAILFGLSINYANVAAILVPKAPPITLSRRKDGWRYRVRAIEAAWAGLKSGSGSKAASVNDAAFRFAEEWIEECLEPNQDMLAPTISAAAYAELLPVIWVLFSSPGASIGEAFLTAVMRQAGTSSKRRLSDAFLTALIVAHEDRFSTLAFYIPLSSPTRALVTAWLSSAPRTLWELGARDTDASETLLRLLLEIGKRGASGYEAPYSLVSPEVFAPIAAKFAPFFHLTHPARGAVEGPWAKLPTATQRLALDVARVWVPLDDSGRLASAVDCAVRGTWAKPYWSRS